MQQRDAAPARRALGRMVPVLHRGGCEGARVGSRCAAEAGCAAAQAATHGRSDPPLPARTRRSSHDLPPSHLRPLVDQRQRDNGDASLAHCPECLLQLLRGLEGKGAAGRGRRAVSRGQHRRRRPAQPRWARQPRVGSCPRLLAARRHSPGLPRAGLPSPAVPADDAALVAVLHCLAGHVPQAARQLIAWQKGGRRSAAAASRPPPH